ncbi:MAG TPA: metal ABC transporter permease [Nitrososphaeraceae archaeon]|nr:metal ABC transporter permease [Nitrososphaeraceae archaeon]
MLELDFLYYGFIQRALLSGLIIAITCSTIGIFLVLRRQSLFGDAISHIAFGGIAIGTFLNIYPIWTAMGFSVAAALGITKIRQSTKLPSDSLVAVMLSLGLGIGVTLVSLSNGFSIDLFSFLFGSILLIGYGDLIQIIIVAISVVSIILVYYKKFLYIAFDEDQAKISGIKVEKLNYLFTVLVAITIIVSMKLVGILLISSLLVLPNISSLLFNKGFKKTVLYSIALSTSSVFFGIVLSYYYNLAPSGMIVLLSTLNFIMIFLIKNFYYYIKKLNNQN